MKRILPYILFLFFFLLSYGYLFNPFFFSGSSNEILHTDSTLSDSSSSSSEIDSTGIIDSLITIRISVVGDIMCHSTQMNYAAIDSLTFDFDPVFRIAKDYLNNSDLLMGNLETVIAGKQRGLKGYPVFNAPDEFLFSLRNAGFDHLFLSNNHAMDMGYSGAARTAALIDSLGMSYSGILSDSSKSDSICVRNINGIKIAIISFTYGYNNNSSEYKSKILRIKRNLIYRLIRSAKKYHKADLVAVYFHFGIEYSRTPNEYQRKVVRWAVNAGADMIFASHPHVIQPFEFIKSDNSIFDSVLVTYSLGNFISNQRWRFSDCGIIANVDLQKNINTGRILLQSVSYLPVWIYKGRTDKSKREFIIFPSIPNKNEPLPDYFSSTDSSRMHQSFQDTKRVVDSLGFHFKVDEIN